MEYRPEGRLRKAAGSSLQNSMLSGEILEAKALLCDNEHNLHFDLGSMRGIMPRSECALGIAEGTVRDIAIISRVNKPVCFKILEIEKSISGIPFAVLSRKAAQAECMANYVKDLIPGDVINAAVTHIEPFGAFCDVGCGITALLPIDGISVSRIPNPSVRLHINENIRAVIRSIDEKGRLTLSQKELLGTWKENAAMFRAGETVPGIIRSIESYGIFIELTPNLAGLAEVTEGAEEGQQAGVFIKSIIPEKMKVKLIIVDSFRGELQKPRQKYFFTGKHMDRFLYSPEECGKIVESVFGSS
ncbi:MAG: S1 RNA-binding domain-containing protein [Clostridiales bacterium]|nr:S1 RNA-binding domain-containing protein [Clostridiales bacterium]